LVDILLRETYDENVLDFFYDANGNPSVLKYNGAPYYYILNLQGDVIRLVDAHGNTAACYEYDPYGNAIDASGSHATINPLRYRGYYYDNETGLYYLQSRYYDPVVGRFINSDSYASTGQGILGNNMFAYCNNSPTNWADYSGHAIVQSKSDLLGYVGVGFAYGGGSSASTGASAGIGGIGGIAGIGAAAYLGEKWDDDTDSKVIANAITNDSDNEVIFTPDPYDFNPKGLDRHVCVEPGKKPNGGIIKWEIPGTKIAVFEWDEDSTNGPHYHTLKVEWKNKHYGPHHPIGSVVPEPWKSMYF